MSLAYLTAKLCENTLDNLYMLPLKYICLTLPN